MTKNNFLAALREALQERGVSEKIIEDTIMEYGAMIDDAVEGGESIDSLIKRMGSPEKVAKALAKNQKPPRNKFVAVTPFLATIAFFLIGVIYQAWHPGWLVFLAIPISGMLTSQRIQWRGLLVFLILIVFVFIGWQTNLYNPLWSLFLLLIPFQNKHAPMNRPLDIIAKIYTVVAVAVYHLWVIVEMFTLGGTQNPWDLVLPLIILVPIIAYAFMNGTISISFKLKISQQEKHLTLMRVGLTVFITINYVILGVIVPGFWHPGWLIFLLIPVVFMLMGSKKFPLVAITPFIAVTLFILVGEYVNVPGQDTGYTLSWLFFLLIPITGILFGKGD